MTASRSPEGELAMGRLMTRPIHVGTGGALFATLLLSACQPGVQVGQNGPGGGDSKSSSAAGMSTTAGNGSGSAGVGGSPGVIGSAGSGMMGGSVSASSGMNSGVGGAMD